MRDTNTNENTNKGIYIRTMQACDIYCNAKRGAKLYNKYTGMIPYSLQSLELIRQGIDIKEKITPSINPDTNLVETKIKLLSNDLINVKYNNSVWSSEKIIEESNKKILKKKKIISDTGVEIDVSFLEEKIKEAEENPDWEYVSCADLRKKLDTEGFNVNTVDYETGEILCTTRYVAFQRSSAKSRTGQCLYINESKRDSMVKWSRMGLNFDNGWYGDYAGLLAYESLTGSALEDTITINPDNILMVDDLDCWFTWDCNVVRSKITTDPKTKKETKLLDSFFEKDYKIKNSLFDGQSCLDTSVFKDNVGFYLLRNFFTKTAAFHTNLQSFLRDHCPEGQDYDTWMISNQYCDILAKDILMIMCPSSLKILKYSADFNMTDREMFTYWKDYVKKQAMFGVFVSMRRRVSWELIIMDMYYSRQVIRWFHV